MREPNNRLSTLGEFFTKHLATPTAGAGSAELLELVQHRRIQAPDGSWGWAKAAKNSNALAGAVGAARGARRVERVSRSDSRRRSAGSRPGERSLR